jgi:hypothetical protein
MKNNNKLTNILLIILIVIVLIVGFFIIKKPQNNNDLIDSKIDDSLDISKADDTNFDPKWDRLSKNEMVDIVSGEKDAYFETELGLNFSEEMDLTGDGIPEAIIEGNGGNNGVSFILIKNDKNDISIAKQKNKDGTISTISLLSVGRAMVSEGFELAPNDKGFYTVSKYYDEKIEKFKCNPDNGLSFYSWNTQTNLFEWDSVLTKKYTTEVCK